MKRKMAMVLVFLALAPVTVQAETAAEAWKKLSGKFAGSAEFALPKNDPDLPNVLIYGDSISIHYHAELKKALEGEANLYRIFTNGGDSGTVIEKLETMEKTMRDPKLDDPWDFDWDVIQLNVGLHDLKYWKDGKMDKAKGKQVNSPEDYEKNLEKVIPFLKKFAPEATLIFATTTPVPENESGRVAGDAERYNAVAIEIVKRYPEILVNDLFYLSKPVQSEWWTKPGNVHFNSVGQQDQATQTAGVIRRALKR